LTFWRFTNRIIIIIIIIIRKKEPQDENLMVCPITHGDHNS